MKNILVDKVDIVKELEDQTAEEVDVDVTFTCELSKPNVKVEWCKGKKPISTDDKKYTISNVSCEYTLTVKGVKPDDESDYTILVKNKKSTAELYLDGKEFNSSIPTQRLSVFYTNRSMNLLIYIICMYIK